MDAPILRPGHPDPGTRHDTCGCCDGIARLTPVLITNRPNLPAIGFRTGGHARHKQSMLAGLSSATALPLAGLGTRDDGDFSIALIDAWSAVLEVLGFYQERLANEAYIGTATERFSLGELARLVGYRMHPGAAAETELALLLDDPPGGEPDVTALTIPVGTRIQSKPGPGETAQVFETTADLDARGAWNRLRPRQTELVIPTDGDRTAWLVGTPQLATGDLLLFVGAGRQTDPTESDWNVRRVVASEIEADGARTRVEWDEGLEGMDPAGLRLFVLRERASLFGHNAPDPKVFSKDQLENFGFIVGNSGGGGGFGFAPNEPDEPQEGDGFVFAPNDVDEPPEEGGLASTPIGSDQPPGDWDFKLPYITPTSLPGDINGHIPLDAIYKRFVADSWIVLSARRNFFTPYRIRSSWDDGLTAYAISGKSTGIEPDAGNGGMEFRDHYRGTSVWGASEELTFTERAISDFVAGSKILLDGRVVDLPEDRRLVFRGPRARVLLLKNTVTLTAKNGTTRKIEAGEELVVVAVKAVPFIFNAFFFSSLFGHGDVFSVSIGGTNVALMGPPVLAAPDDGGGPGPFGGPGAFAAESGSGLGVTLPNFKVWTLRDSDGFVGTVSTLASAFKPVPAREDDEIVSEVLSLKRIEPVNPLRSRLVLDGALVHIFDRSSLAIHGNVAAAAHGEGVTEILGAGDPSVPFQKFVLGQAPVTHRLAPTATGVDSTLNVNVDGVAWEEVPDLYERGAEAQVYRTVLTNDGQTIVEFGDGHSGARPAPGRDNIVARFSKGIGRTGNLREGQLTMPLDRPLGLRDAFNPAPATGGVDPEAAEEARRNVPLYTLTLGRIVSITDYRDFALGFPGIAKAESRWVWKGVSRRIVITVAGEDAAPLPLNGPTYGALLDAFREFGDPLVAFDLINYAPTTFRLAMKVMIDPAREIDVVLAAVEAQLRADFSFSARDFAREVALSAVVASAHRVDGVRAVDIDRLYRKSVPQKLKKVHDRLVALPGRQGPNGELLPAEILTLAPGPFDWLETMA